MFEEVFEFVKFVRFEAFGELMILLIMMTKETRKNNTTIPPIAYIKFMLFPAVFLREPEDDAGELLESGLSYI